MSSINNSKGKAEVGIMVMTALMTALVAVATIVIPIPVPFTNGYIHLGDSMIFLSVLTLGWRYGAVASGLGSAFADLFLGYVYWAPWTLIIKGGMALIMGLIIYQGGKSKSRVSLSCIVLTALWVLFNFVVNMVIKVESGRNAGVLMEAAETSSTSQFAEFLTQIQSYLMIGSLVIPLALIIAALFLRKSEKYNVSLIQIIGMSGAGIFMVFGYYIAGGLIYGNFAVSAFSVPWNALQFVVGFVIATLVAAALSKTGLLEKFNKDKIK